MSRTFRGGIHPASNKEQTFASPIETMEASDILIFPMQSHIGAPCVPAVKVGDKVKIGTVLGKNDDTPMSVIMHSSVSGTVSGIEPRFTATGNKILCVVVENDHNDDTEDNPLEIKGTDYTEYSDDEIIEIVRRAGISGMGGAAFPTHVKLFSALNKTNTLIINGSECEPYITSDHRAMIEYPRAIAGGVKIIAQVLKPKRIVIAIEDNKEDAISTMKTVLADTDIEIVELKTKYPQGGEKQLIKAVSGIEVPPGKLPTDTGCAVFNIDTCASIYRAVVLGRPVTKRIVTVSGDCIATPKNLLVRIGTTAKDVIDYCGGFTEQPMTVISGGPMMGITVHTLDVPVTKGCSAILAFKEKKEPNCDNDCIRCGKCIRVCPMNLMPATIYQYAKLGDFDECEKLNVLDCMECGSCAYTCPSRLYLVQTIRLCKAKVNENIRTRKAGKDR